MLWHKSWLETRWRFVAGFALLVCSAAAVVFTRPEVVRLLRVAPALESSGEIGRQIRESVELSRAFPGYIWAQWFRQNLSQLLTLFAILLGAGGLLSHPSPGAALFTLSLPVSRRRIIGVRIATGLAQLLALAILPSLLIPILSPAIGERYSAASVLLHGLCVFAAGSVLYSIACLLSTEFQDLWRPLLLSLMAAGALSLFGPFSLFRVMSGETYFRTGSMPWTGLLLCVAASAAILYGAAMNFARRDF